MKDLLLFSVMTSGLALTTAGTALAQDNPPPDTSTPSSSTTTTTTTTAAAATPTAPVAVQSQTTTKTTTEDDGTTDHDRVVRHLGVTYFNISQIPIATNLTGGSQNLTAPVVGVRYWLSDRIGLNIGLGIAQSSGTTETTAASGTTTSVDAVSLWGFAAHAGVPIALATGKHYTFLVTPEITAAFASGTIKPPPNSTAAQVDLSGFRLDVGGRIGAEVHFGFIGVPQLALQASVGLAIHNMRTKGAQGNVSRSDSAWTFGTSVQETPWAIFTNNIAATYYF